MDKRDGEVIKKVLLDMKSQREKQTGNDRRARKYESEERSRRIRLGS